MTAKRLSPKSTTRMVLSSASVMILSSEEPPFRNPDPGHRRHSSGRAEPGRERCSAYTVMSYIGPPPGLRKYQTD